MQKKYKTKLVLFDLDGTLIDTAPDFHNAINKILKKYNRTQISMSSLRPFISEGSSVLIEHAFKNPSQDEDLNKIKHEFLNEYQKNSTNLSKPFDGIPDVINFLKKNNIPYGIVTNKLSLYAKPIVNHFTIFKDSKILVCPDNVKISKPDPEGILLACRKLKVNPKNTVYLGDHPNDLKAANSAGASFIGCLYGYSLGEGISDLSVKLPKEIIQKIS